MDELPSLLKWIAKPRFDEDGADKLNSSVTVWIITVLAITISAKEYGFEPIKCWCPAQFYDAPGWPQYVDDYCFVENTYYVARNESIPLDIPDREDKRINYYQWVPFILALQALMFGFPSIFWRGMNKTSDVQVGPIIQMVSEHEMDHVETTELCAKHLTDAIRYHNQKDAERRAHFKSALIPSAIFHSGGYLTSLYILHKLFQIANLVIQYFILASFLGFKSPLWGFETQSAITNTESWKETGYFPRVTLCDFEVRFLANTRRYTVQCVLMINILNEKIFIFLYYWFGFVAALSILDLLYWLIGMFVPYFRRIFLHKVTVPFHPFHGNDNAKNLDYEQGLREFAIRSLPYDAVFILRLMNINCGGLVTSWVANRILMDYADFYAPKRPNGTKSNGVKDVTS